MNLQDTFYIVGIISMTLYTLLLIAIIILLFYIRKKVSDLAENISKKFEVINDIIKHPKEVATSVAAGVAETALTHVVDFVKSKKNKRS
jgi:hypothetical protein